MAAPKVQTIKELRSVYDMFTLKGKAALVTGAGGGIGRSTAAAFAEMGARVALMDIPQKEEQLAANVADIKKRYGAEAMYVLGDVADEASVKRFVGEMVSAYGTVDVVHNNAGVGLAGDDSNIPLDQWNRIVGINQTGILLVGRTCANIMLEHKHGGSIINTSSMSGLIVNRLPPNSRYGVVYPATKAAVEHMTKAMAMDYCRFGIRFNSVCYGYIISGLHDVKDGFPLEAFDHMAADTPMGRTGSLEESVGCVVYLASDLSSFATGSTLVVDGGYTVW
jgi:NAD(P)-dependent dehydrogenase (short-subunit alcohol dehydrogenase family)